MFINESSVFMSIGLPIIILYIFTILSVVENRKMKFPLRDVCISVLSLDLYKIVSLFEVGYIFKKDIESSTSLVISFSLLLVHIAFIPYIKRLSRIENDKRLSTKFTFIRDVYIGMFFLMTNAVSLLALIKMAGGMI